MVIIRKYRNAPPRQYLLIARHPSAILKRQPHLLSHLYIRCQRGQTYVEPDQSNLVGLAHETLRLLVWYEHLYREWG
jgi:hypothetical protein